MARDSFRAAGQESLLSRRGEASEPSIRANGIRRGLARREPRCCIDGGVFVHSA